jgi:hypothetical protein
MSRPPPDLVKSQYDTGIQHFTINGKNNRQLRLNNKARFLYGTSHRASPQSSDHPKARHG